VVFIRVQSTGLNFFLQPVPTSAAGSGVIIDGQGHILTNNHVVEGASQITVALPDGRTFTASIVGRDPLTDLAVIKISSDNLPVAALGDSDKLVVGETVIAIGNALALAGGPTVTSGIVGNIGRSIQTSSGTVLNDLIQTDAAINPGNSGGPLVNLDGEVIGINTAIASGAEAIGFAIAVTPARPIIEQLITKGRVIYPWIGVGVETLTPALATELGLSVKDGVLIRSLQSGGPADQAGLRENDVITAVDGLKVTTVRQLQDIIRAHSIGDKVTLTIVRGKEQLTKSVVLAEMPRGL